MFNRIGEKLQLLAIINFIIVLVGFISTSIVMFVISNGVEISFILLGIVIMILAPLFAWLSSCILYAFGALVDNTDAIRKKLQNSGRDTSSFYKTNTTILSTPNQKVNVEENKLNHIKENNVKGKEDAPIESQTGKCAICGADNVGVWNCMITDQHGIRYKKICIDCIVETNAKILD